MHSIDERWWEAVELVTWLAKEEGATQGEGRKTELLGYSWDCQKVLHCSIAPWCGNTRNCLLWQAPLRVMILYGDGQSLASHSKGSGKTQKRQRKKQDPKQDSQGATATLDSTTLCSCSCAWSSGAMLHLAKPQARKAQNSLTWFHKSMLWLSLYLESFDSWFVYTMIPPKYLNENVIFRRARKAAKHCECNASIPSLSLCLSLISLI